MKLEADSGAAWDEWYPRCKYYILVHPLIEPLMRTTLFRWISEVCSTFSFQRETFHKCLDYFDRFMATQSDMPKELLQLVGVMCLIIAVKMEELVDIKFKDFAKFCCHCYSIKEMRDMESLILFKLKFHLNPLTSYHQLCSLCPIKSDTFSMAVSLLDACLLDVYSLHFSYHTIAHSCLMLASKQVPDQWTLCLSWLSKFLPTLLTNEDIETKDNDVQSPIRCDLSFIIETSSEYMNFLTYDNSDYLEKEYITLV
jgi:cyclin E